jgi:hypothetical protein
VPRPNLPGFSFGTIAVILGGHSMSDDERSAIKVLFNVNKRVYVEFVNADVDGLQLDSDSGPATVRLLVKMIYVTTGEGEVGKSINSIPFSRILDLLDHKQIPETYTDTNHVYTIVERLEEGNEVLLRLRHSVKPPETKLTENPTTPEIG